MLRNRNDALSTELSTPQRNETRQRKNTLSTPLFKQIHSLVEVTRSQPRENEFVILSNQYYSVEHFENNFFGRSKSKTKSKYA